MGKPSKRELVNIEKDKYRKYFLKLKEITNLKTFYEKVGIKQSNFWNFMDGKNSEMSLEKLKLLYKECRKITKIVIDAEKELKK